jgi:hypothetical protein
MDITKNKKKYSVRKRASGKYEKELQRSYLYLSRLFLRLRFSLRIRFRFDLPFVLTKLRNTVALRRIAVRLLLSVTRW